MSSRNASTSSRNNRLGSKKGVKFTFRTGFAWAMRRPGAREAPCLGFHQGTEVVAAPSTLLLQVESDLIELVCGNAPSSIPR